MNDKCTEIITLLIFSPCSGCSELVATCSKQDIRLWDLRKNQELLRITVPNMVCNAIAVMNDGKSIISGWDDGRIRAFYPESGKPMYTMENAYGGSVTALSTFSDCCHVISGSNLGHVVVWEVPTMRTTKVQHLNHHSSDKRRNNNYIHLVTG